MSKISLSPNNDFCPQTLFLYGTYDEDGKPNFGLFCWASYIWDTELGFMTCIGDEKLTKDRIRANGVFSANLVTEKLLPLADYLGNTEGRNGGKKGLDIRAEQGRALNVPILSDSPVSFELEVTKTIETDDGTVFLCRIRNVLQEDFLCDESVSLQERIRKAAPVSTTCGTYFSYDGNAVGAWGEPQKSFAQNGK
ncbi:MAG: flavin reductase [Oscillospiraceae bacterium]|nr:flavin reductase [Oscillospiraceae bacterium]